MTCKFVLKCIIREKLLVDNNELYDNNNKGSSRNILNKVWIPFVYIYIYIYLYVCIYILYIYT